MAEVSSGVFDNRENITRLGFRRNAFVLSTTKWDLEQKGIILWCNPNEVGWNIPVRGAVQNTHGGQVYHTWKVKNASRGGRDTYYDFPQLSFQFQSGNIVPFFKKENGKIVAEIAPGMVNFYQFMEMIDQNRMIETADGIVSNFHRVKYYSTVFPGMVLEGYFTPEGIQFTQSAEDPLNIQWTSNMVVYKTTPKFFKASDLGSLFEQVGFSQQNATREVVDPNVPTNA